ncbi:MAG TPA: T9SS type A sorting domain-containing protein [Saprospiraceae bacterium]|nr:T9SS type A sorting domain-containing protein [Saprospiraceae bacterium]
MVRRYIFLLFFMIGFSSLMAQLPNGSQAPDFTVTDINGQTHSLSNYLNQGKTVFLKFFATWCSPCWSHHQSGALNNLYEDYGPNGTDEVMVILIEGDPGTNVNCLYGSSGCNASTQGDWTAGKSHPIANDHTVRSLYSVNYYPTIYGICPDGVLTEVRQRSADWYYNWHLNNCALNVDLIGKNDVNCHGQRNGSLTALARGGTGNYNYNWSNGFIGNQISGLSAGNYMVTVSDGASTIVGGPYNVAQPDELIVDEILAEDASCENSLDGVIFLAAQGGTQPYEYEWSDGEAGQERDKLAPGTYQCTIYDALGCQLVSDEIVIEGKQVEPAVASADTFVCEKDTIVLSVNEGASYEWSNGSEERFNQVEGLFSEWYVVTVTYATGCTSEDSVFLTVNEKPILGEDQILEFGCDEESLLLSPNILPGIDYAYEWEALDGGSLNPGNQPWQATVNSTGQFRLTTTDPETGCMSSVIMSVEPDENLPSVDVQSIGELDCNNGSIQLDGSASSQGDDFSFQWSTSNPAATILNDDSLQPTVNSAGVYQLTVRNDEADCENTKTIEVEYGNLRHPDVSIGFEVIGNDIRFYNASRDKAERYYWVLPDDNSSIEESPTMNRNALEGDLIEVCLNATNQCGNSNLVCQTIDLTDESYYFEGTVTDQFGERLDGIEILHSDGMAISTSSGGEYQFTGLDQNQSFEVQTEILHEYQLEDINTADLNTLWQGLLEGKHWTDTELLAGDLNGDRLISLADVIILQRELLMGQLDQAGHWLTFPAGCMASQGALAVNNCPGFYDVHLLQASRLKNDFIAIQKADLDKEGNQFGININSRYNYDGGSIRHMMNGWQVLALKVSDIPNDINGVFANGVALQDHEYRLEDGELFILKLMEEKEEQVEVSFGKDPHVGSNVELRLFPNPAVDRLQVSFLSENTSDGSWRVTDYTGQTLLFSPMNYDKGMNVMTIPTDRLFSGVFFMAIEMEGQVFRKKFVVSKK